MKRLPVSARHMIFTSLDFLHGSREKLIELCRANVSCALLAEIHGTSTGRAHFSLVPLLAFRLIFKLGHHGAQALPSPTHHTRKSHGIGVGLTYLVVRKIHERFSASRLSALASIRYIF